jgi:hypothetical protein
MIEALINIAIMLICLALKYLYKFQNSTPKGTKFSFKTWWDRNFVDFIASLLCLPLILWLSTSIIHYIGSMNIDTEMITDRVLYAIGGFMGNDIINRLFKMFSKNKG